MSYPPQINGHVTAEDIAAADHSDLQSGPISQALARMGYDAVVGRSQVVLMDGRTRYYYTLDSAAAARQRGWDQSGKMAPFYFTLTQGV